MTPARLHPKKGIAQMTTYTVFRSDNSADATRGLTLEQAADALMTEDGYAYEWRTDADGYHTLWISDGSANSTRGARHLNASRFAGFDRERALLDVVNTDWHGCEAMTDEAFSAMLAACEE